MHELRDREASKKCFEDALAVDPKDSYVLHHYGLLMKEEYDDIGRAEELIRSAVECNKDNFAAWTSLGNIMNTKKQHDAAIECYNRALAIRNDYGRALKNKALVLQYTGKLSEALDCYKLALEADPYNATIYIGLGQLMESNKDLTQACAYFESAVYADPQNPQGHLRLAVLKTHQKDYSEARRLLETALKLDMQDCKALLKYAALLDEHFGEHEPAVHACALALECAPKYLRGGVERHLQSLCKKYLPALTRAQLGRFPTAADVVDATGGMISVMVPTSASEVYENPVPSSTVRCPRGHYLYHIRRKPYTYKPKATWACEECKRSIGGPQLKVDGAYYCTTCKYDLCFSCSKNTPIAHLFPQLPIRIGGGGNGEVYKEFVRERGRYCAVKHIPLTAAAGVKQEVALMQMFQHHPHIVRVFGYDVDAKEARITMELMHESVADLVHRVGVLHELDAWRIIKGALKGLWALHEVTPKPVVHRDIKPDNLLLTETGDVKLADFGISKHQAMTTAAQTTVGAKGTPQYLPPEVCSFHSKPKWKPAADVWALACTWVSMTSGYAPYEEALKGATAMQAYVYLYTEFSKQNNFHPPIPAHLSDPARSLLELCFISDPDLRISAEQLLKKPYFSDESVSDVGMPQMESREQHTIRCAVILARRHTLQQEYSSDCYETDEGSTMLSSGVSDTTQLLMPPQQQLVLPSVVKHEEIVLISSSGGNARKRLGGGEMTTTAAASGSDSSRKESVGGRLSMSSLWSQVGEVMRRRVVVLAIVVTLAVVLCVLAVQ